MTPRFRRHPDLRLTEVSGEGVVLHLGSRSYFSVSETGLVILQSLEVPRTDEELVQLLVDQYDVTHGKAVESVHAFLDLCRNAGLLIEDAGA